MKSNPFFRCCSKIWTIVLFTVFLILAIFPGQPVTGSYGLVLWQVFDLFTSAKIVIDITLLLKVKPILVSNVQKWVKPESMLSSWLLLDAVFPVLIIFLLLFAIGTLLPLPKSILAIFPMSPKEFIAVISFSIAYELNKG